MKKFRIIICLLFNMFFLLGFLSCDKRNPKKEIGGFEFGMSKQKAIDHAKSLGYSIEPLGDYYLLFYGDIDALDLSWNKMSICVSPGEGIIEISLLRKYSETTDETMDNLFEDLKQIFPESERLSYIKSYTITDPIFGNSSTTQSDYASLFEIKDKNDDYTGNSYYILSHDEFGLVIDKKVKQ